MALTDEVQNLVPGHLKAIRAELPELLREQRAMKARMISIENQLVQIHKGMALFHDDFAVVHQRTESLEFRVELNGRRLELREAV